MSVLTSNIDRNECRGTVASANQWPDHRYRETRNRRLHKIPDTTGSTSAIRKSDLLVSISLLLVSKSDFRVAERQARYFPAKSAYSENRRGRDVAVPAGLSGAGWKLRAGSLAWHRDRFFMRPV